MPATCFSRLPRGAGAIAQRCRLSLQGSPRRGLRYGVRPALRSGPYCSGGLKCTTQVQAHASQAHCCGGLLVLASVLPAASSAWPPQSRRVSSRQ